MTAPFPLTADQELALFKRTCERLIANPDRLKVVIQQAGITDDLGRLTSRYGSHQSPSLGGQPAMCNRLQFH